MSKRDYTVVDIQKLNDAQARHILDGVELPTSALDQEHRLKEWLRSPLMLQFACRIHGTPEWTEACSSRSRLYECWAGYVTKEEAQKCNVDCDRLLAFYKATALKLLETRTPSISLANLDVLKPQTTSGGTLQDAQLDAMEILIPPDEDRSGKRNVKFFHESAYEYFTAAALKGDFEKALQEDLPRDELQRLQLGQVELDYLQSSVYGYLSEMLGPDFPGSLLNRLGGRNIKSMPAKLLRNLVESLGCFTERTTTGRPRRVCLD